MRRDVVLYDLYFPIWVSLLVPMTLLRVLATNYVVNILVVGLTLRLLRVRRPIRDLAGYAAGATLLGLGADLAGLWACEAVPPAAGLAALVTVAGALIFIVNYLLARWLLGLAGRLRLLLALVMGVVTAPWLALLHWSLLP